MGSSRRNISPSSFVLEVLLSWYTCTYSCLGFMPMQALLLLPIPVLLLGTEGLSWAYEKNMTRERWGRQTRYNHEKAGSQKDELEHFLLFIPELQEHNS